jgi:signal transduction histidine kinase/CheY-like chemotaxis protein
MKGERIDHFETVRQRKDGSQFHVSLTVSPIFDAAGNIIGASKIARDITSRKVAEERLYEESTLLNLLNETGKAIATDLDTAVIVQKVTDAATTLTGAQFGAFFYNVSDESGESYQLFALSGAPRQAFEKFGQPRATQLFGPTFRGEATIRSDDVTKDARYGSMGPHFGMPAGHLPVRSYLAVPVVSRTTEVIGGLFFGHRAVGVFTQRSELLVTGIAAQAAVAIDNARLYERVQHAAEERKHLLEAERAARVATERVSLLKDEFLATLSHELRTPLNAILGWAEVLGANKTLSGDVAESVRIIRRNAKAQAQLIEDLLDMSRIVSGKVRLDVHRLQPADVVQAAVDTVHHSAEMKQVRMKLILDPFAGPISGDPNRLQQCVWNLLSNAIKFTPKGGEVRVSLGRVNSHVEISVSDTGKGIAPEFLPHLFERFTQADASTTRLHGGLGLGLSIVKSLIELHGGSVQAVSRGIDQGAVFTLQIPLAPVDGPHWKSRIEEHSPRHPPDLSKLNSLLVVAVDDERDARRLLERVLSESGATVFSAESAAKGLQLVREKRPHIIISDIGMPDEDGYEFIRKVRQLPADEGGRTPAIALSAFSRPEDRTRALRAGYQAHIVKPADPAEMITLIASLAAAD